MTTLLLSLLLFAALFLGAAALAQSARIPPQLWQHPLTFALSFLGVTGVLFFFGSIELVGRYGVGGLTAIFAFSGLFILSPLFLDPIRWISRSHAFSTLPDLLVYRFRDPFVTKVAGLLLALSCLPLAAAQYSIVTGLLPESPAAQGVAPLWLMAGVTVLAVVFVRLFGQPERSARAVPIVCASASTIAIIALLCTGLAAMYQVFGGFRELNVWAESSGQDQIILRFSDAYALILLFFPLALIMPQQGYLLTFAHWWPHNSPSSWIMPLLLLLITLPVFPVLWAGLHLELDAPLQTYYLALPAALDLLWLKMLTLVAILMIATCLITVTALAIGKTLVTCSQIPADRRFHNLDLDRWLHRRHFVMATIWLALAFAFSALNKSASVTDLTITGMIGMSQLLPGIVATLYMPKINAKGFLAGLLVGASFWIYGVVAPVFFDAQPPSILGMSIATGPENWPFWLLESLMANLMVALMVSMVTKTSAEETQFAHQCMVDNLPTPQRQGLEIKSQGEIRADLGTWIGQIAADREMILAVTTLAIAQDDLRPVTLRALRDQLCFQLSGKLGTVYADRVIDHVMPAGKGPVVDDISLLESRLAAAGPDLHGLAAELNKLRLYHRQTLQNLPIGVCSIDAVGEILLWNNAMVSYTGISAAIAEGANLANIADPWGGLLTEFRAAAEDIWPSRRISASQRDARWFHLSKHNMEDSSPVYDNYQVILMEDITEYLKLVRELSHAERLTSVGRLAAGVAHEIGNPVTGISCIAQDMIAEPPDRETLDNAQTILGLTERITSIVSTLIDFSRRGVEQSLSAVAIKPAVDSAIKLLTLNKDAKAVEFRSTIPEDLQVKGDLHQLTQVFVNLLSNARDASASGGLVEVAVGELNTTQVDILVTDQGSGIPQENLGRVMDPFFTTKDPGEGTGLGLSLVYSIIRTHDGSVSITSPVTKGRGTRVSLTLNRG